MKYAVIIPDGAADLPIASLGGRTPLEAAITPNLDAIAEQGRQGTVNTTPEGFGTGSDVCSMSLLGYDPAVHHTGRAPIEAAATGRSASPTDVICRMNLVTIDSNGLMEDHSAGGIDTASGAALFAAVHEAWQAAGLADELEIWPGVEYRSSLVDRSGAGYAGVETTPPHAILGSPAADHGPSGGEAAERLRELMAAARGVLHDHEINRQREERGSRRATDLWIWGQGVFPSLPSFKSRFGLRGAMTTAVDLLAGIAALIGWERIGVEGLSGWHDNDYEAQGRACVRALDDFDIVCCHVESPDEAAHQANPTIKTAAIEAIDRHCVGPIVRRLSQESAWRLLVLPDHYTLCGTRMHDPTPPPFLVVGTGIEPDAAVRFSETNAQAGGPHLGHGHRLLEQVLFGR